MQHNRRPTTRFIVATTITLFGFGALGACSSDSDNNNADAQGGTYTWWDPYPQHQA